MTVTVSVADVMVWNTAVTDEVPGKRAVTSPREPFALDTVATVAVPDCQVTTLVRSYLFVSL